MDDCLAISAIAGKQHLRSAGTGLLSVPRTRTTLGMRSFAVAGPVIWNSLPAALRTTTLSPLTFARHLKAHHVRLIDSAPEDYLGRALQIYSSSSSSSKCVCGVAYIGVVSAHGERLVAAVVILPTATGDSAPQQGRTYSQQGPLQKKMWEPFNWGGRPYFSWKKTGDLLSPRRLCVSAVTSPQKLAHHSRFTLGSPIFPACKNLPLDLLLWGPLFVGPLFGRTCRTCLNPPLLSKSQLDLRGHFEVGKWEGERERREGKRKGRKRNGTDERKH